MTIVSRVLALPTLEPMTPGHMEKLTTVVMSCLFAAVSATTTNTLLTLASSQQVRSGLTTTTTTSGTKDEEQENIATLIVEKGVSLKHFMMLVLLLHTGITHSSTNYHS